MYQRFTTLNTDEGLHARPASIFIKRANEFQDTNIKLVKGDKEANAKSMMSVLGLGVLNGDEITISAEGEFEKDAVEALVKLLEGGF